jgi:hypothetical protein
MPPLTRVPAYLRLLGGLTLTALAAATSASAAPITFESAVLADSPLAYWRFGETASPALDGSGNGHNGTYSGGVTLGQPGIGGGDTAALFDGIDGGVTVPNDALLGPDFITMEALVTWNGPNAFQQRILEKSFFGDGSQASYGLSILPDGTVRVEIRAGGAASLHTTIAALGVGDSAHLVATFDGVSVRVYLDGVLALDELSVNPGTLQDGLNALGLGNQSERNRPFNGLIDEIALYDHALTAEQVSSHFDALAPVPEPGTLSLVGAGLLGLAALRRRL